MSAFTASDVIDIVVLLPFCAGFYAWGYWEGRRAGVQIEKAATKKAEASYDRSVFVVRSHLDAIRAELVPNGDEP